MSIPNHCPKCGSIVRAVAESTGKCQGCGRAVYANSRPAAGVLLVRGNDVLLIRRGRAPGKGKWDIPGGFLNEGEAPEFGAVREIREELGWQLEPRNLRLMLTSVNYDSVGAVLDILFETQAPNGEPVAASDVAACGWFPIEHPPADLAFVATASALKRWRAMRG